ncbi:MULTISPECIES: hypothetical protein [unclassified Minwuia]|jgi:hypothetical protein|uniref:hypothetical protein n=1 Tax=unclassified Minwuia TaxID=2618799 RepID=UPI00247ADC0D|nr:MULTISPECIES: hypothetical protein [unclassified Minwuia]
MILLRIIGYLLLFLAIAALGAEILMSVQAGEWVSLAVGDVWAQIDRESIGLVQVGLERYVHPYLFDPVLLTILLWPSWLVAGVPALLILLLARRRRQRRMFT